MSEFPNYRYDTGLGNVGSYQVAGKPFVSGGINALENQSDRAVKISFPSVTRWIYIINHDNTRACDVQVVFLAACSRCIWFLSVVGCRPLLVVSVTSCRAMGVAGGGESVRATEVAVLPEAADPFPPAVSRSWCL